MNNLLIYTYANSLSWIAMTENANVEVAIKKLDGRFYATVSFFSGNSAHIMWMDMDEDKDNYETYNKAVELIKNPLLLKEVFKKKCK